MKKVLAERDVTVHEALHQLLGLDLHASNITVVTTSLEPTRAIQNNKAGETVLHESYIDIYAGRGKFIEKYPDIDSLNFVQFAQKFDLKLKAGKLVERRNPCHYSVHIVQSFSPVHTNDKYWMYCKYELLRYKPWSGLASSVLGRGNGRGNRSQLDKGVVRVSAYKRRKKLSSCVERFFCTSSIVYRDERLRERR